MSPATAVGEPPVRRREYAAALALTAAGATALLAASARTWASAEVATGGGLAPVPVELPAAAVAPVASALGWAGLAALAALFATKGLARRAVGLLVALMGAGALAGVAVGTRPPALAAAAERAATAEGAVGPVALAAAWPVLAAAGAVLLFAGGVLTLLRGTAWPTMSSRYDRHSAPRATRADDPAELWKSLDSGADPTDENADPKER
ncbi:Trp biosynthesis-associated membrane protein [Actinorugispora endophytica]|uniref:Putative membrane protein (TIGR02234 family) n=1 Tax=Actinorugispora endophytica TaxID=1605990 RepID=A0A4R6UY17_9ACTN|nr:Trp biosynthesis-associated membrane protein [Actinorugispora endophytica]TDQ48514.1 putative membrane protein (TIGR02234 family) [Actinorugispora endophytica]